jgi:ubiquinone/menaquinone biosynthesis C-methylase UbiE
MADVVTEDRARYRSTYDTPLSALLSRIWKKSLHLGLFETPADPLILAHERTKLALAHAADLAPGRRVFEAACGTGETARFFVRKFQVSVVATNIAEVQTREARGLTADAGLADNIGFALADYHSLPVTPESFDIWFCQEALLYAADRRKVLEEACRAVRPGGRLVLTDLLLADHVRGAAREAFMTRIKAPHMWSIEQWDRLFDDMGLDVIERHDWSDQAQHTFANVMANLDEVRADPAAQFDADLIEGTADRVGAQLDAARRGDLGWCCYAVGRA